MSTENTGGRVCARAAAVTVTVAAVAGLLSRALVSNQYMWAWFQAGVVLALPAAVAIVAAVCAFGTPLGRDMLTLQRRPRLRVNPRAYWALAIPTSALSAAGSVVVLAAYQLGRASSPGPSGWTGAAAMLLVVPTALGSLSAMLHALQRPWTLRSVVLRAVAVAIAGLACMSLLPACTVLAASRYRSFVLSCLGMGGVSVGAVPSANAWGPDTAVSQLELLGCAAVAVGLAALAIGSVYYGQRPQEDAAGE